jgi:hypothetical protein
VLIKGVNHANREVVGDGCRHCSRRPQSDAPARFAQQQATPRQENHLTVALLSSGHSLDRKHIEIVQRQHTVASMSEQLQLADTAPATRGEGQGPTPAAAAAASAAPHANGGDDAAPLAWPADALACVLERLPPGDLCAAVPRLSRAWREWAAPRRQALLEQHCAARNAAARGAAEYDFEEGVAPLFTPPPLWRVREAWPQLSEEQKSRAVRRAAAQGDIPALEWVVAAGADLLADPKVCAMAAYGGQLAVLQWARQHGCPWDWRTCGGAARGGHLGVLQWARQHGCPWDAYTCRMAASGGHLGVLQWARQHGCPWTIYIGSWAAAGGHLDVLQWTRQQGCPWEDACSWAASGGHLHVIQWARQHGCPWDEFTCHWAARDGHLNVLQWARQHGCPWSARTCSEAAGRGHLAVIQWARQHGCPWDGGTLEAADRGDHFDVLEWAQQHGCPSDYAGESSGEEPEESDE